MIGTDLSSSDKRGHQGVHIRELLSKGGVAVLEEALFAGSNFAIGVLLGRWLPPADYGAFTTAYALFLLLGTAFYSALCVQPLLVVGSREKGLGFQRYFGSLLIVHAIV